MQNFKLIKTFQTLNAQELKRLLQFLQSPFYNANPNIAQLYLLLRNEYPDFSSPRLDRNKIFSKLFPGRPYDHKKMLNLMSGLTALLEKYLTVLQLEKEEITQQKLLLRSFAERPNCYEFFEKKTWDLNAALEAQPYRDEVYFWEKMELNLTYFGHPDTNKTEDKNDTLKQALQCFDAYCDFSKVKLACAKNAKIDLLGSSKTIDNPINLLDKNQSYILLKRLEKFQREQDPADFPELVDFYIKNIGLLRENERGNILKILLNYCTQQLNRGALDMPQISFQLYKIGLQYNCLMLSGKITKNTFQNIAALGIMSNEFEWVKNFMDTYHEFLDDNIRADTVAMSMAHWHFGKGAFNEAIQILQHNFNDQMDVFKAKSIIIRSWYELYAEGEDCLDVLLALLDAFEKFTRRDKTQNKSMKEAFLKFILYTKKLANRKWDDKLVAELGQEVLQEKNIALKRWLLEKTGVVGN